ncbi:hypothetical protein MVEN_02539500 [Mycena venus]|uniref:Yeast cell wall synthesis Kre9/Knh1-like N-terminal domain-containing protein n=1 Tax=Mycena venus TaxID=2733690 RepID=A0A8H6U3K7_9AGAR|nr:hypothetical protein MVEN_02539500 [Mycena venus]
MSPCLHLYAIAALAFAATAVAVSDLQVPSSMTAGSNVTITWSSDSSDTNPLTLALFSSGDNPTFAGGLAIATIANVQSNQYSVVIPQVIPTGSYVVSFLSITDASDVITSSSPFTISAPVVQPSSLLPTTGTAKSGTIATSSSATATAPGTSSSIAASLSSLTNSLNSAASSALSSAQSAASSALSSLSSAASGSGSGSGSASASGPSSSGSGTTGTAIALTPGAGMGLALMMVLGGLAVGAGAV